MEEEVLLVSEERLKSYTSIDDNVRVEEITPYILQAQDLYIQPVLGTLFYERLKEGVRLDNLNNFEDELLQEYVAKPLMYYAFYLMLPFIKYKVVQKGILNGSSEETTPTNLDELKYLRQSTINTAEFYQKRLVLRLRDFPGRFEQYDVPGITGMRPDKTNPYFSGLVTKAARTHRRDCLDCDPLFGPIKNNNS